MIQINKDSPIPLHEQIAAAIEKAGRDGALNVDRNLPSVRALAGRLGVSPATVSTAYRELVARRIVEARPRSGYRFVQGALPELQAATESRRELLPMHRIEPRLELHPTAEFGELIAETARGGPEVGGYEDYRGYAPLRDQLSRLNELDGIRSDPRGGFLVCAGAQHAIALTARAAGRGTRIAIEDPVYPGARLAFAEAEAVLHPVPTGPDGPDLHALEEAARTGGLDLYYCCPTYGNPSGRSWPLEARERTVRLAEKYGFFILEDDYLRDLDYLAERLPPLAALAARTAARVLHVRTFSKCLLPALRIAGVSGDGAIVDRLLALKTTDDICGSALLQRPLARYLEAGSYARHLEKVRPRYAKTREAVRRRAERAGNGLAFEDPPAGLCLLATLPEGIESDRYAEACRQEGVLVSPGKAYWADERAGNARFRIGFGGIRPEEADPAFAAMERAVERARGRSMENFFKNALL